MLKKFIPSSWPSPYNIWSKSSHTPQNPLNSDSPVPIQRQSSSFTTNTTTVNPDEIRKFEKMSADWWNPNGDFKALHSMNKLRVELVRNGFHNTGSITTIDTEKPLEGMTILDIGCGGGILSQPLGRLGAKVIGLDAGAENIAMANAHLGQDLAQNVNFICCTAEDYLEQNPGAQFDGVVASEVIEHVSDPKLFLKTAAQLVKPSGSIFITTINRTNLSWLGAIIAAEYVFNIVPRGTHEWKHFVSPEEIQSTLSENNCRTRLIHGMFYNVFCNSWSWTRLTSISYALHAVKSGS